MALHRIGAAPISNLDTETTKSAIACRAFYDQARDRLLRQYDWAFAGEVQKLTSLTDDGKTKYLYKYSLPSDPYCLRVRRLKDSTFTDQVYAYALMGRYIYTDLASAYLDYTKRVEDPDDWDPLFTEALSWLLAAELIRPLGNKTGVDAAVAYEEALLRAKGQDALERQEEETLPTLWTDERLTS